MQHRTELHWHGDNSHFVVEVLLPALGVLGVVRQVTRWTYGYDGGWDGTGTSFEQKSNGTSVAPDWFLGRRLKEPFGVDHDMLCALNYAGKPDPSGRLWSLWAAARFYREAMAAFGCYPAQCWLRWAGLVCGNWACKLWVKCKQQRRGE
jgi:hypothetical protein